MKAHFEILARLRYGTSPAFIRYTKCGIFETLTEAQDKRAELARANRNLEFDILETL